MSIDINSYVCILINIDLKANEKLFEGKRKVI